MGSRWAEDDRSLTRRRFAEWAVEEAFDALGKNGGVGEALPTLDDSAIIGADRI